MNFEILKIEEKNDIKVGKYINLIVRFDEFPTYVIDVQDIHYDGKLKSTLYVFQIKNEQLVLISDEGKEFDYIKDYVENFLRGYFME